MLFNSLEFIVFFISVTLLYYQFPFRFRWLLLLTASCYFYMAFVPKYIVILGFTIVIDYIAGLLIEQSYGFRRRLWLIASLAANVSILAVFKYFNFFVANVNEALQLAGMPSSLPFLTILLPIGLSFHTFQAMSYTIEVYRGNQKAERHFGIYALYVMFYPQLVAGPIERPQNVLHQFHEHYSFSYDNLKRGLIQMAFGFFKKVVIADRLALVVDSAYGEPEAYNSTTLLISTIFYSFQIYCDFSGYSDIGIGAARVMGYSLMDNFRSPYESKSISEFWKRWHISLSTWFRDYLYIPLGGNRVTYSRHLFNLFLVFLISGFWHGASWNFIIWGALHGFYLIIEQLISKKVKNRKETKLTRVWGVLSTYTLVTFAWIFFRATSLADASIVIKKLVFEPTYSLPSLSLNNAEIILSIVLIIILLLKEHFYLTISTQANSKFILLFTTILLACYFFGVFGQNQFIYFQF